MRKVQVADTAWQYLPTLLDLLDRTPAFRYYLAWMLLGPGSTPATTLFDLIIVLAILKSYRNVDMNVPSILNNMAVRPGTDFDHAGQAKWLVDVPEPLQKLHAHMASLAERKSPGYLRRWFNTLALWVATQDPTRATARRIYESTKLPNQRMLAHLIKFLLDSMEPREAKLALAEARKLATDFHNTRIVELFDSAKPTA
jgi:hypothetical protein